MRNKKAILFFLLTISVTVNAQQLALDSILRIIEQNNPELKMFNAQISAMDAYAQGAKSWDAPQVGTGFFMTPYNPMMWRADKANYNNGMGSYMLSVQQMIPNQTKLKANETYMKSMSGVEKENKNYIRNQLLSDAKMSYNESVLLQKKIEVLKETETFLNLVIQSTEIRYSYNQDKLGSIYKAKAQLGEVQSMQLMFQNELQQNIIMLNTLMNREKTTIFQVDTTFSIYNYDIQKIDTSSFNSIRSDLKAIDQTIVLLKAKKDLEYSKRLPDFGIKYDHMFSFGTQPQLFTLMGMVTVPIVPWSNKMYKSSVLGLENDTKALEIQKQGIINETTGKLETLKSKIGFQKQQIKLYEESIIPSFRKNYQATLLAYEQNTEELFMVLDAIQMLRMNQITYLDLVQQLLLLQTEYEKEIEQN